MHEGIESDLRRIEAQDEADVRTRFVENLRSPSYGLSAGEYVDRLYDSLRALRRACDNGVIRSLPAKNVQLPAVLHTVADRITQGKNPQEWHEGVLDLEAQVFQNQLVTVDSVSDSARASLEEVRKLLRTVRKEKGQIDEAVNTASSLKDAVKAAEQKSQQLAGLVDEAEKHVSALKSASQTAESQATQATQLAQSAREEDKQVHELSAKIREFFKATDSYSERINTLSEEAKGAVSKTTSFLDESKRKADNFFVEAQEKLTEYGKEAERLLSMAVGASLFTAFDRRRKQHRVAKWVWAGATIVAIGFSIWFLNHLAGVTGTISNELGFAGLPASFWIKLSTTPLILAAIGFFARQYGNSRRFEEAYAFKSALSVSLEPYKNLVLEMHSDDKQRTHLDFVVETIRQIYAPLVAEEASSDRDKSIDQGTFKMILELVKSLPKG